MVVLPSLTQIRREVAVIAIMPVHDRISSLGEEEES
jgi:hypothetical protein